ncbi:hypothetical protein OH492_19810 [Vibrio chagasii]|nr:hypothetical protein [Vibrio chagasii]
MKEGREPSLDDLLREQTFEIEMRIPALLTDDYMPPDINTRLSTYKRGRERERATR